MSEVGTSGATTVEAVRALFAAGRMTEAEQGCRDLLSSREDGEQARLLMASVLASTRGPAAAEEWLIGCAREPDAGWLLLSETGRMLIQDRRTHEALPLLVRAAADPAAPADTHLALGVARQTENQLDDAVTAYRAAIERAPELGLAHFNLGTVFKRQHRFAEALSAYRDAARLSPDSVPGLLALGTVLVEQSLFEEAAEVLSRAAALAPRERQVLHYLGFALLKLGRGEPAVETMTRLQALMPGKPGPRVSMSSALLTAGRAAEALTLCEELRGLLPGNRQLIANQAIALTECGRAEEAAALLRHDRFLWRGRIQCPAGFDSIEAFNAALVGQALSHPALEIDGNSVSCHKGQTSGELMVEPKGPLAALENTILAAIDDYWRAFEGTEPHAFLASRPARAALSAWVTILRSQGHQFGHIHPTAWLSGVYYASLPPEVKSGENGEDGWIEFGAPPRHYRCAVTHAVTRVRPEEGLLVLFPSFYYHRTLPFESAANRITIAFDYRDVAP